MSLPRPLRPALAVTLALATAACAQNVVGPEPPPEPPAAPADSVALALDAVVDAYHGASTFDGVVVVLRPGAGPYERSVGLADRGRGVPNAPDVRYPVASVTKQVASTVAYGVAEGALLDLDAPVETYLPGVLDPAAGRAVTVRHLLTASSRLPVDADDLWACDADRPALDARAWAEAHAQDAPAFAPGSRHRYTNTDYVVLQAVLEAATGQPFAALVRDLVAQPAGLDLGLIPDGGADGRGGVDGLARGYVLARDGTAAPDEPCLAFGRYGAAGAAYATPRALARYGQALLDDRLVSADSRRAMWTADPALGFIGTGGYVYDKGLPDGETVRVVERRGAFGSLHTLHAVLPDEGVVLVVVRNAGEASLDGLPYAPGLPDDLVRVALGYEPTLSVP